MIGEEEDEHLNPKAILLRTSEIEYLMTPDGKVHAHTTPQGRWVLSKEIEAISGGRNREYTAGLVGTRPMHSPLIIPFEGKPYFGRTITERYFLHDKNQLPDPLKWHPKMSRLFEPE